MNVLGFDIGGTKCAVVLAVAGEDQVIFRSRLEVATHENWKQVLDSLITGAKDMLKEFVVPHGQCVAGVSCGGPLDCEKGLILSPPNLPGWDGVPVVAYLEQALSMPVRLQNDADACALAEWRYGAGKGSRHMIFLTFGTGLGAGLILNGKLYTGASHMAGEVGHLRVEQDGPVGYGKAGSLEGFCSGGGIAQLAVLKARQMEEEGKKASYVTTDISRVSTADVAMAAQRGEADALQVFAMSGRYFGRGLAILIDLLNPEMIVAGSIYTRAGAYLRETMMEELQKEALPQSLAACRIVPASLGEQIGDYGAVVVGIS